MLNHDQLHPWAFGLFCSSGILAVLSLLQVTFTDPGGVPDEWDAAVRRCAHPAYALCASSGRYKPPRAHYDVITQRVVLNFDHFCPWVVNSIGFFNRKFFLLFLVYLTTTSIIVLCILGPGAASALEIPPEGRSMDIAALLTLWSVASHALVIAPLLLFTGAHLYMAAMNETSIEDNVASMPYNHGVGQNLRSVFGEAWYTWPLPIWAWGPVGDGIHWKGHGNAVYGAPNPGQPNQTEGRPLLPMQI